MLADSPSGRSDRVVVVGAHLNSVPEGPGINDNGSGSATILEVASQMARLNLSTKNQVRFAFWGAEEAGLVGSTYYVGSLTEQQARKIELNLNFDMLGSPNFVRFVYDGDGSLTPDDPDAAGPPGSDVIERAFDDYFAAAACRPQPTAFDGRSDYGPFIDCRDPGRRAVLGCRGDQDRRSRPASSAAGPASRYDPCYHQACDDIDNLSLKSLNQMSDAVAYAVAGVRQPQQAAGAGGRQDRLGQGRRDPAAAVSLPGWPPPALTSTAAAARPGGPRRPRSVRP